MALSWTYQYETLPVDDTVTVLFELPIPEDGETWPDGTTGTLEITDRLGKHTFELSVEPEIITGRIEAGSVAQIGCDARFKIWVTVPGDPDTEIPLYAGPVVRGFQ